MQGIMVDKAVLNLADEDFAPGLSYEQSNWVLSDYKSSYPKVGFTIPMLLVSKISDVSIIPTQESHKFYLCRSPNYTRPLQRVESREELELLLWGKTLNIQNGVCVPKCKVFKLSSVA